MEIAHVCPTVEFSYRKRRRRPYVHRGSKFRRDVDLLKTHPNLIMACAEEERLPQTHNEVLRAWRLDHSDL
jgi:hypothetical protein